MIRPAVRLGAAAVLWLFAAPVAAHESRIAPADTYRHQLGLRLHGGLAHLTLTDARIVLHDENQDMRATGWTGGLGEGELGRGYTGGFAASWGVTGDVKVTFAFDGFGASAEGEFTGNGPATTTYDPVLGVQRQSITRLERYTAVTGMLGATVLLREFGWSRIGLAAAAGAAGLAGAVERGNETGPIRSYWWQRTLAGAAPAFRVGLEWEWLAPAAALGIPLSGYLDLGWRYAHVRGVQGTHTDSTGARTTGAWKNPDGTHRTLDLSGIEVRVGLQLLFDLTPADPPPAPGVE